MNLEALISALVPGRARGSVETGSETHPESGMFQDWLQREAEQVAPLPQPDFTERTTGDHASRRAGDLTPVATGSAIAFAERPLLVETSLEFGPGARALSPDLSDIRWTGEVLQYRIADFLRRWTGEGNGDGSARVLTPSLALPDRDHRANPADRRAAIFSMVPIAQTAGETSLSPIAEGQGDAESARPAAGRRDQAAGALAARLMEHFGRTLPNGPVVHLQPEQDGLWRLFLRLPKLAEGALAELREELKGLAETFGLKLGTFEIVETRTREDG